MASIAAPSVSGHDAGMEMHSTTNRISSDRPREKADGTAVEIARELVLDKEYDIRSNATKSVARDVEHMRRMGKDQQLIRNFRLLSVASFTAVANAAWEVGLFTISPALVDGGRPALLYATLWNFIGFAPIYLSMAEMASMAPIAGSQYHWVSEFAPESLQKILSYFTGWSSTMAWQAGNALGVFLVGTLVQCIISITTPTYTSPPWHATLLVIGAVIIAYAGNVFGYKFLPHWQNPAFVIHIVAYLAIIIPIWVNAPRASSTQVWTEFENSGGWPTLPLAVLVGQLSGTYTQVGMDTAIHMSEEVKDAGRSVPLAMLGIFVVNFLTIFPVYLTLAYHIPSVTDALNDPTTYPAVYVLRQSMSEAWVVVVLVITLILLILSNIAYFAAVTRDLFAFARDQGLPFSNWISKVDSKRNIPENACILTSITGICLGLIYLGSPLAFYAITSLGTVAILQCYTLSIGCLLWRRIRHPETLPPAQFSLGKFGVPINAMAVAYAAWAFFWCFWPQSSPVTAAGFNWAPAIFVAVLLVALIYFVFVARRTYAGPVALVEGRKAHFR